MLSIGDRSAGSPVLEPVLQRNRIGIDVDGHFLTVFVVHMNIEVVTAFLLPDPAQAPRRILKEPSDPGLRVGEDDTLHEGKRVGFGDLVTRR